jgi:hypothetical protein
MQRLTGIRGYVIFVLMIVGLLLHAHAVAHNTEKMLFLVVDKDEVIASNTRLGRFDRLVLGPREKIVDYKVANAVAVVVTNRRFVAYGILHGGWNSRRAQPDEQLVSLEVADYSATVLTSDRILNYSGRAGAWSETKR